MNNCLFNPGIHQKRDKDGHRLCGNVGQQTRQQTTNKGDYMSHDKLKQHNGQRGVFFMFN